MHHRMRRVVAGTGKSIIDLTNLEWFKDSDFSFKDAGSTPADTVGDLIFQHTDRSPNGHDLIQTGSVNRPTIQTANGKLITRYDGINDIMSAGDVLDDIIAGPDKKFAIIMDINNYSIGAGDLVSLWGKHAAGSGDRECLLRIRDEGRLIWFWQSGIPNFRGVRMTDQLDGNTHVISMLYDGSIDTNDGLDRVTFRVDKTEKASTLLFTGGSLPDIPNTSAPVTTGALYDSAPSTGIIFPSAYDNRKIAILSNPTIADVIVCENEIINDLGI